MNIRRNRGSKILAVKAEQKCGCITLHLCEWRQGGSVEKAEFQIFGNQGRVEKRETSYILKTRQRWVVRNCKFTSLRIKVERKCGRSRTSDIWQSRQNGSAAAEFQIFGSPCRDVKCGSATSHFCAWRQSGSVEEAEIQIFCTQGRVEVRRRNFTSLEMKTKC